MPDHVGRSADVLLNQRAVVIAEWVCVQRNPFISTCYAKQDN